MSSQNHEDFNKLLSQLQCQFLCCYSINSIDLQVSTKNLTWEQQKELVDNTCGYALNQKYPIKIGYQLNFLKRLIQVLEKEYTEVHDEIYECYCKIQQQVAKDTTEKYAYKHYILPAYSTSFTLRESKSFVAEGTTGLCSWQASLALADFLLHNANILQAKNVMELGAGTGLCGFILSRCCAAPKVLITDGSSECVELMRENIFRNFANATEVTEGHFSLGENKILTIAQLNWNAIESFDLLKEIKPNVLLAADVVYDDSVFDDLASAIDFIFKQMDNEIQMFLAATVRNEHTLNTFLHLLEYRQFCTVEQQVIPIEQSNLYWDRTTPVKILKITRKS